MVSWGLAPSEVGKVAPSSTERLASWWWRPQPSTTEARGSLPIAAPPMTWAENNTGRRGARSSSAMAARASGQLWYDPASLCAGRTVRAPAANCSSAIER